MAVPLATTALMASRAIILAAGAVTSVEAVRVLIIVTLCQHDHIHLLTPTAAHSAAALTEEADHSVVAQVVRLEVAVPVVAVALVVVSAEEGSFNA